MKKIKKISKILLFGILITVVSTTSISAKEVLSNSGAYSIDCVELEKEYNVMKQKIKTMDDEIEYLNSKVEVTPAEYGRRQKLMEEVGKLREPFSLLTKKLGEYCVSRPSGQPQLEAKPERPHVQPEVEAKPERPHVQPEVEAKPERPEVWPGVEVKPERPHVQPEVEAKPERPEVWPGVEEKPEEEAETEISETENKPEKPSDNKEINGNKNKDVINNLKDSQKENIKQDLNSNKSTSKYSTPHTGIESSSILYGSMLALSVFSTYVAKKKY